MYYSSNLDCVPCQFRACPCLTYSPVRSSQVPSPNPTHNAAPGLKVTREENLGLSGVDAGVFICRRTSTPTLESWEKHRLWQVSLLTSPTRGCSSQR